MADNEKPSFIVNGKTYEFPESLTMGEMCDAELHFGVEFGNNRTSGMRMIAAMLWIAVTRKDPSVTVDDIRALPPEVFESFKGLEDDAGPPEDKPDRNDSSGGTSNGTGDDRDVTLEATGTPV